MNTLVSGTSNFKSVPQISSPNPVFHFPSHPRPNPRSVNFCCRKWLYRPKTPSFCSVPGANSVSYGGWDDPRLGGGSDSGESNQLRSLLRSLGIDDKKYIFVYLFGFICALAISRVRVSSIVVFPATVIVLAAGFSIGFVNGGHVNELSLMGTKKRPESDDFSASVEKLRKLVDLFDGLDFRISDVKRDIRRGIERSHISVEDLESYVRVMESIGVSASNARAIVEGYIKNISVVRQEEEREIINHKSNRKNKQSGEMGFNLLRFVGGLFTEKPVDSKATKVRESVKRDLVRGEVNNHRRGNVLASEKPPASLSNGNWRPRNVAFFGEAAAKPNSFLDTSETLASEATSRGAFAEHGEMNFLDMGNNAERVMHGKQYSSFNKEVVFVNNQRISMKMGLQNEVETQAQQSNFLDSMDFSVNVERMESEASFGQQKVVRETNGSAQQSHSQRNGGKESYETGSGEEWVTSEDGPSMADQSSVNKKGSMISDDIDFNRYLMEATALIKEARECLRVNQDEGYSETILYKSAELLSKAIDMKPMSLLAVGQLGNTYLLHGELKLKISKKLRNQLAKGDQDTHRDKIASLLINVCEECEELLVEAGRKYRVALTIDGNDMRALYNWGLALSFRAQLIADIGPEAAVDADKVYLAAIDKFDAMMSKSNAYAPDALFRWGLTLQQRSRLRRRNNKEKVKLLQQARRLYEDALDMDSNNLQLRQALSSCVSELQYKTTSYYYY